MPTVLSDATAQWLKYTMAKREGGQLAYPTGLTGQQVALIYFSGPLDLSVLTPSSCSGSSCFQNLYCPDGEGGYIDPTTVNYWTGNIQLISPCDGVDTGITYPQTVLIVQGIGHGQFQAGASQLCMRVGDVMIEGNYFPVFAAIPNCQCTTCNTIIDTGYPVPTGSWLTVGNGGGGYFGADFCNTNGLYLLFVTLSMNISYTAPSGSSSSSAGPLAAR
jgi:hypothetical protein